MLRSHHLITPIFCRACATTARVTRGKYTPFAYSINSQCLGWRGESVNSTSPRRTDTDTTHTLKHSDMIVIGSGLPPSAQYSSILKPLVANIFSWLFIIRQLCKLCRSPLNEINLWIDQLLFICGNGRDPKFLGFEKPRTFSLVQTFINMCWL